MLCQNCKENEATVRYTEIINGEKRELILCEKCSKNLGVNDLNFSMPIDFSSFFGGILEDYESEGIMNLGAKEKELKCNFCNMTYSEFVKNGKFGCSNCYNTFESKITPMLKTIHGDNNYLGRKIKNVKQEEPVIENKKEVKQEAKRNLKDSRNTLEELQDKLKLAIKEERYEDAAKYRDEIKKRSE